MSSKRVGLHDPLDDSTQAVTARAPLPKVCVPGLTILCHPDLDRVGEVAALPALMSGKRLELSRLEPLFGPPGQEVRRPLEHPRISRSGLGLVLEPSGALRIERGDSPIETVAGGQVLGTQILFSADEIASGVVFLLSDRITLLLHEMHAVVHRPPSFGMVGEGRAIMQVRLEIDRVADLPYAILLMGESGTGKELAAQAIYENSPRRGKPFLSVNMGAIPPQLAASELFGTTKGSFTGADRDRPGYFQRASGGTLFLDEIGETPLEIQVLLLRALDSGQIQPVGGKKPQQVDVRLISATDSNLAASAESGEFRSPLLYRLSNYSIEIPPLRERREDFGRLFFHFLRQEMKVLGEEHRLRDAGTRSRPWMSAELISRLAAYDWPGNVRQLQNVVRELAVDSRGFPEVQIVPKVERLISGAAAHASGVSHRTVASGSTAVPTPMPESSSPSYRDPGDVSEADLLAALRLHHYVVNKAAAHVGISRPSFYKLMGKYHIRKAGDLTREEIERSWYRSRSQIELMVDDLQVSKKGLKDRMQELGLR